MGKSEWNLETIAVQGGYDPKKGEARVMPITQSTTYKYDTADEVAALFDLAAEGHMYTRISNPSTEVLEKKIAALEGGVGAVATASGQAAVMLAVLNITSAGQHLVCASTLYGGTISLIGTTLRKLGIEVTFVDPIAGAEEIERAFRPETRMLYAETIGNPGLGVLDFDKFSSVARKKNVPLVIDNTFGTPILCRPFDLGASIVIHSATKFLDGHAVSLGGIVVDSGKFDWRNGKYPELVDPDPSYHGISYVESFGAAAYITKLRVTMLRDMGANMSPFNAFLTNLGTETLHIRMARHCENTLALAQHLEKHPKVSWVNYPGLPSSPDYELACKYLPQGASGILTFGVKGGVEAGKRFIDSVGLAALVVHVGDLRTSVLHPASTTHRQLSEEQQIQSGVAPDMIRVSVGLENIADIIADFDQALDKA